MPNALAAVAIPSLSEAQAMTTIAASVDSGTTDTQYWDYLARGAALFEPQFGSTVGHLGPDALDLLHRLSTNSLLDLEDGEARRTVLTNEKGRIVDVLWVLKRSERELLLVSDAPDSAQMQEDIGRFTIIEDAELDDLTGFLKRWYVVGPDATQLISELLPELDFAYSDVGSIRGMDLVHEGVVLTLRTDAAGPESWLLMVGQLAVPEVRDRFARLNLQPVSSELFEFVRIASQEPIAGKELTEDVNPLEAGLTHLIDFEKGCYVGQEVIARLDTYDKVQRSLVGFRVIDDEVGKPTVTPRDRILGAGRGRDAGWVTSVARDPETSQLLGMAILRKSYCESDVSLITERGVPVKLLLDPRRIALKA